LPSVSCGGTAASGEPGAPDSGGATIVIDASRDSSNDASAPQSVDAAADSTADGSTASNIDATDGTRIGVRADAAADAPEAAADSMGCSTSSDSGIGSDCGAGTPTPCDDATCPGGCCDANGICQSGVGAAACGSGGSACQTCPAGSGCFECPPGVRCATERFCGCSPQSCPSGCCNVGIFGGTCQAGTFDTACGSGGTYCGDCTRGYYSECDNCGPQSFGGSDEPASSPTGGSCSNHQCVYPPPAACPFGCVDGRGACQPGASNTLCGSGGSACTNCTATGGECFDQQCASADDAGVCNQQSCPSGCCDSNEICEPGSENARCGTAGITCHNCVTLGEVCSNRRCGGPDGGPGCGWFNCNGCCDSAGACVPINSDTRCGALGSQCADCTMLSDRCIEGACTAPDGAVACSATCIGCCDSSGTCQLGYIDSQCGERGGACQDCTSAIPASTCDLGSSPRTCASQQTTCPAPYAGCPAPLQEQAIERQGVCSTTDLENAAVACAGGLDAFVCVNLANSGGDCGSCLRPFIYDFASLVGIHACAAQYLDAACNHSAGCLDDCSTQACAGCNRDYASLCSIQAQSGTCAAFLQASACLTQALDGPAALCNPASYQGNFGAWLKAVGTEYCAQ
jgi:hypothetical protein